MQKLKSLTKIVLLNDWYAPEIVGGVETTVSELAKELSKKSYLISVFTLNQRKKRGTHYIDGIKVHYVRGLHLRRRANTKLILKIIEKIRVWIDILTPLNTILSIKKVKPDFIIMHEIDRYGPWIILFAPLFFSKNQLIRVHHDLSETCLLRSRSKMNKTCLSPCTLCIPKTKFYAYLSHKVGVNVFNSKFVATELNRYGFSVNHSNVGNPVSGNSIIKVKFPSREITYSLGYVGRITKLKGIETIMLAVAKTEPKWKVHAIGPVSLNYKNSLIRLAIDLNIELFFHLPTEKPYSEIYPHVDCIVVASNSLEAFGRIPIEATLEGIPIISSNIGGLPEALEYINPKPKTFLTNSVDSLSRELQAFTRPRDAEVNFEIKSTLTSTIIRILEEVK
jgi:glycosyltransferase involved in cell wall biosynthesis